MRAIVIEAFGGPDCLVYTERVISEVTGRSAKPAAARPPWRR
jgi:hypothetical protein